MSDSRLLPLTLLTRRQRQEPGLQEGRQVSRKQGSVVRVFIREDGSILRHDVKQVYTRALHRLRDVLALHGCATGCVWLQALHGCATGYVWLQALLAAWLCLFRVRKMKCCVVTVVQEAGRQQLQRDIRAANHKFDETLSCYTFMDAAPAPGTPLLDSGTGVSTGGRPPLGLLEFPPLAHYLNSLVSALNTLRLCCFTALLPVLLSLLTESLNKVVRSLVELHEVECSGFSAAEAASFGRLCGAVKTILLPHLNATCLRGLYPLNHLASVTGSSALQLAKMNFGQLDVEAICRPLKPFLHQVVPDAADETADVPHLSDIAAGADSDLDALLAPSMTKTNDSSGPASTVDGSKVEPVLGSSGSPDNSTDNVSVDKQGNSDSDVTAPPTTGAGDESLAAVVPSLSKGTAGGTTSGNTEVNLPESLKLGSSESLSVGHLGSGEGGSSSELFKDEKSLVPPQVVLETDLLSGALAAVAIGSSSPAGVVESSDAAAAAVLASSGDLAEVPLDD
ncbi:hypothetical protein FHG87_016665 [Trinorchestia longiramus]|nr:hypothetical protein FHG87_016665 [Trinorchestia longiramus]